MLAQRLLRRGALGTAVTAGLAGSEALALPAHLIAITKPSALESAAPFVLSLAREVLRSMATIPHVLVIGVLAVVTGGLFAATMSSDKPELPPVIRTGPGKALHDYGGHRRGRQTPRGPSRRSAGGRSGRQARCCDRPNG